MQHGPLTPLGRQLRSVLANITAHKPPTRNGPSKRAFTSSRQQRNADESERGPARSAIYKPFSHNWSETPAAVDEAAYGQYDFHPRSDRPRSRNHETRHSPRTRTDHLMEALKDTGQLAQDLSRRRKKIDYTYADPQSRTIRLDVGTGTLKNNIAEDKRNARLYDVSIQRILGDSIRHKAASADYLAAEWEQPFELSSEHSAFLQRKGLTLQDIEAWADIATAKDPFDAAQKLAQYAETHDSQCFPIFVYLNLLKRDYLGARALRLLIHQASIIFKERAQSLPDPDIDRHPTLLAVIRLLRHAREVWPQSMPAIVQLMLDHLKRRESQRPYDREELSSVTYELNKIMGLVSYATAVQPFKDNPYQEAAIVPILRYMAEHDPPLHIDRQGYRAVIRIQLAQKKKEPNELQWAELKALSWPPWKVDRTAMDASIDAEYGASRASATLGRMREAGYRPLHWEKTAELYTGWDPDGTPTIQMRALLEQPGIRMSSRCSQDVTTWAAKISSTRTIQEAWACYLAWEDMKLPHDQAVYLAILTKLRQEELRQHRRQNYRSRPPSRKAWPLLPGDSIEISPLPPSTHLYTYTRTRPPTVDDFYDTMISRNVAFKGYCLAFLIRNATTLQVAVRRIKDSTSTYPDIAGVLVSDSTCDIGNIPPPIYAAIVEVFARFGRVPLSKASVGRRTSKSPVQERFSIDLGLNPTLSITRAIDLLRERAVMHRRLWTVLLQGLSDGRNHARLSTALSPQLRSRRFRERDSHDEGSGDNSQLPLEMQRHAGAINAHRIARRLLALMRQNHLDPDLMAVHSFCLSTESMTIAAWSILRESVLVDGTASVKRDKSFRVLAEDTRTLLHNQNHHNRLKGEFQILVGAEDQTMLPRKSAEHPSNDTLDVPRLLVVPGPAFLHAYVRALGWLADYDGLLATVRWMHDHREELVDRSGHDRNGADMIRRTIVALRVFLERSWLADSTKNDEPADGFPPGSRRLVLSRLRCPAGSESIAAVKELVEGVEEWEGWPTDEEVEEYAADRRFDQTREKLPNSNQRSDTVFRFTMSNA